jgi:N12 class adenine-specific DNA methylase
MIGIREVASEYISRQADEDYTDAMLDGIRHDLNKRYDAFVQKHGFLSEEANKRLFRADADAPLLLALEHKFDKGVSPAVAKKEGVEPRKPSAQKADIMVKRTVFPFKETTEADNADDAMIASLVNKGFVDLAYMRELYKGKTDDEILNELGDKVFFDPKQSKHVLAEEYLSGDVKTKLADAQQAALEHPNLNKNVLALQKVQPADVEPASPYSSRSVHRGSLSASIRSSTTISQEAERSAARTIRSLAAISI